MFLPMFITRYLENLWATSGSITSVIPGALLLAFLSLLALFKSHRTRDRLLLTSIPGPRRLPFVGTKWTFWFRYRINKLHEAYQDMHARYGPIFAEWSGNGCPIVCVCNAHDVERVLRQSGAGKAPYRPPTEIVACYRASNPQRYSSLGLVNEQGERWSFLRRNLTKELTSTQVICNFKPVLNDICDDFIKLLLSERNVDNIVDNFHMIINKSSIESSCALMLGARLGLTSTKPAGRAGKLSNAVREHFTAQRDSYYGLSIWKYIPTPLYNRFVKSEEEIHDIVTDIMNEASLSNDETSEGIHSILFSIMNNHELDERDKKSAIIDFISAGIETLANSLVFLLHLISHRPDYQRRIREDCSSDGQIARAAVTEAFRLLPTAPFLARMLTVDTEIAGYMVPQGTFVLVQTMAACRSNENFYLAESYLPERWLLKTNQEGVETNPFSPHSPNLLAPFGRGKRMCPGKRFVNLQLQLLLSKLVQRFEIEPTQELDIEFNFLLTPKSPVAFKLVDVNNNQR